MFISLQTNRDTEGSVTSKKSVQDFKISGFQDFTEISKIAPRFQDFAKISRFGKILPRFQDFAEIS